MNTNDVIIRFENKVEYREVENLIRESFWNVYRPGCSEHYVIHVLRDDPAFVKELDFVMEKDGILIGQNMFMRTVINADDGRDIEVLTMGPICITPELKRRGYGKKLLDYTLEKAAGMGFGAVLFEGNINFIFLLCIVILTAIYLIIHIWVDGAGMYSLGFGALKFGISLLVSSAVSLAIAYLMLEETGERWR